MPNDPREPQPSQPHAPPHAPLPPIALLSLVALLAALAGGLGGYVLSAEAARRGPQPGSVVVVRPSPNVLLSVRELSRLETVSFHMERVIELTDKQKRVFGIVEAEDALLLVAVGDVVAGVDLAELAASDVTSDPQAKSAKVRLPPPRIFSSRLDSGRTYVHSRRTDLLAQRKEGLETRARQEAEARIEQAALEAGILDKAKAPAARAVEGLLRSLGFEHVTIEWQAP